MKTILITGCSSGFGLETARYFLERDWNVIATMRTPREDVLPRSDRLRILKLDVTDQASIDAAVKAAGPIDALVNNAGIGWMNALEGTPMPLVREIFETNTFATMAMIQAFMPHFRAQQSGVIVNVTSSTTLMPLQLLSVYTASKAAVNAFTECFALELEPFNVRVRLVIPGYSPETQFGANTQGRMGAGFPEPYLPMAQKVFEGLQSGGGPVTHSSDVAEGIWRAVTDPSAPLRIPAGADAVALSR